MYVLGLIAALCALAWLAVLCLRGGLLAGGLLVLLAGICFSVPFFKVQFGPIPVTADRILLVLLVGQYVVWRRWGRVDAKPPGKTEYVLVALIGWVVLRTFSADYSIENFQPLAWLIIYYLMPFALYWVVRDSQLSPRSIAVLLVVLTAFGAYLALTTIAERYEIWALVFPRYIATTAAENQMEFVGRGRGPLLHPIGNGILLSVCLAAGLCWWPRVGLRGRVGLAAVGLLMLAAIYCTLTRTAWMSGLLVLAVVVGSWIPPRRRWALAGGGLLIMMAVVGTQWEHLVRFKRDRALSAKETADSVKLRPILATVAWRMFLDRPLAGCGYCQYQNEHLAYVSDRSSELPLEKARGFVPHNVLLALLTETGLVGAGLFVALLGLWAQEAWCLWRSNSSSDWARQLGLLMLLALGVYLINGMFHDVSCVPMIHMVMFFLAAVTVGVRSAEQAAAAGVAPRPVRGISHTRLPNGGASA